MRAQTTQAHVLSINTKSIALNQD